MPEFFQFIFSSKPCQEITHLRHVLRVSKSNIHENRKVQKKEGKKVIDGQREGKERTKERKKERKERKKESNILREGKKER